MSDFNPYAAPVGPAPPRADRGGTVFSLIFGAVTVVAVVCGLVAAVVLRPGAAPDVATPAPARHTSAGGADGVPRGGTAEGSGINPYPALTASADAPSVDVYEDFQCDVCKTMDTSNGAQMLAYARSGKITLVWHPMTFLDNKFGTAPSSEIAANGLYCAADAGKADAYHQAIFADQPPMGEGFTTAKIEHFGRIAGISGAKLTTFDSCVEDTTYQKYVGSTDKNAERDRITSTPMVVVDGDPISTASPNYLKLLNTPNSFGSVLVAVTAGDSRSS